MEEEQDAALRTRREYALAVFREVEEEGDPQLEDLFKYNLERCLPISESNEQYVIPRGEGEIDGPDEPNHRD